MVADGGVHSPPPSVSGRKAGGRGGGPAAPARAPPGGRAGSKKICTARMRLAPFAGARGLSAPVSGVATPGRGGRGAGWRAPGAVCGCEAAGRSTNRRPERAGGAQRAVRGGWSSGKGGTGVVRLCGHGAASGGSLPVGRSPDAAVPPRRSTTAALRGAKHVPARPPPSSPGLRADTPSRSRCWVQSNGSCHGRTAPAGTPPRCALPCKVVSAAGSAGQPR